MKKALAIANEGPLSMRVTHCHLKGSNPTNPTNGAIYTPINFFVLDALKLNIYRGCSAIIGLFWQSITAKSNLDHGYSSMQ